MNRHLRGKGNKIPDPIEESVTKATALMTEMQGEDSGSMIAKKDFVITHNEYTRKIKAGEDVSDVPSKYHQNLKTEKVI